MIAFEYKLLPIPHFASGWMSTLQFIFGNEGRRMHVKIDSIPKNLERFEH
jgi:hypothetical protein